MQFTVIESTPGYMPEADDPPVFDTYAEAVAHLNVEVERYAEQLQEAGEAVLVTPMASGGNYSAAHVRVMYREHDLGRFFSVEQVEEES